MSTTDILLPSGEKVGRFSGSDEGAADDALDIGRSAGGQVPLIRRAIARHLLPRRGEGHGVTP